jgi:hypothetical protein
LFTFREHGSVLNVAIEHDTSLVDQVLAALVDSVGVTGRIDSWNEHPGAFDLLVEIGDERLAVAIRRRVDRSALVSETVATLRRSIDGVAVDGIMLMTEQLTEAMIKVCRALNVNAADTAGNAFLQIGGNFVLVSGRRARARLTPVRLGWTSTAVRVGLLLLSDFDAATYTHRQISADAGVGLGSVGPTFDWFTRRGFIQPNHRSLLRESEFLREWSVAYDARVRNRLDAQRFSIGGDMPPSWWKTANVTPGCWSGETAAAILTGETRPGTFTVYVSGEQRTIVTSRLAKEFRLRSNPDGPFEVVEQFWHFARSEPSNLAPWPLIYADLLRIPDPRTLELAGRIAEVHGADRT